MSTMGDEIELVTADQRRRNRIGGLLLGVFVIGVVTAFMITFTRRGLPKDPEVWKRLERERSAEETVPTAVNPIGEAPQPSSLTPAAAPAAPQEPQR